MFEIQVGGAIGLGYIGGTLYRTEVTRDASATDPQNPGTNGWTECQGFSPSDPYCMNTPPHYTNNGPGMGRYVEPNWFGGGSVPAILPWISIPQIAFHFRPHRNIDIKLEAGFGLISIYGGLSAHWIF
jgi:hypothetical protein